MTEILPHFDSSAKHKTRMYMLLFVKRLLVYACHLFVSRFRLLCMYLSCFPESCFCFDYELYSLSHMLGHVPSSASGQLYTSKINKDFLTRLLKRCGPCLCACCVLGTTPSDGGGYQATPTSTKSKIIH